MTRLPKVRSFKGRLTAYGFFIAFVAVLLCFVSVVAVEWFRWRVTVPRDLGIRVEVTAASAAAPLAFTDKSAAIEVLSNLGTDKNVVLACLCDRDGKNFARYTRPGAEATEELEIAMNSHLFAGDRLHMRRPIIVDGEVIGWIYLLYDLSETYSDLRKLIGTMGLSLLAALAAALIISRRLQGSLSKPVTELARTAHTVAGQKDYTVRAEKHASDELGILTDAFNNMLSEIQERDAALQRSHDVLEEGVQKRTAELMRHAVRQERLSEMGLQVLGNLDFETLLHRCVTLVWQMLDTDFANVLELGQEGDRFLLRAGVGWKPGIVGLATVNADTDSQAGFTLHSGGPVIVEDLETETRFHGPSLYLDHSIVSGLSVPIQGKDDYYGVLGVHTTTPQRFDRSDISFLQAVANLIGQAYQRKTAEAELTKLSTAVEQSPSIVIITDTDGIIEYVNPRFTDVTGYTSEEAVGRSTRFLKSGTTPPGVYEDLWRTIKSGHVWRGEFCNRKKNGKLYWEYASISPIRDAKGEIVQFIGVKEDITVRKKSDEQLRRAKELADVANRTKSEFLANMSHEIRTPMSAILGFADILLEPADAGRMSQAQLDAARTIKRNGEHLIRIINDILDLSKIEAGRMTVSIVPCSPTRVISDTLSLLQVRANAKGLRLECDYVRQIPDVIATDSKALKQILTNLIGNAVKFTNTGSVRLEVDLLDTAAGSLLQIDIADTGRGMKPEQVPQLFEPFTQADSSATRQFGGTGLGLAISRRLARLLGGDVVVVDTRVGVGTRFRVTISTGALEYAHLLENPEADTTAGHTPTHGAQGSVQPELTGLRVLVAEDGLDNQRLIEHILRTAGMKPMIVDNGQLAVEAALESRRTGRPFDVILMDMQMPVLDGYEATRTLRDNGYIGPIVALTAHAMSTDRKKCTDAGCDDFATKPINRARLIEIIRSHARQYVGT